MFCDGGRAIRVRIPLVKPSGGGEGGVGRGIVAEEGGEDALAGGGRHEDARFLGVHVGAERGRDDSLFVLRPTQMVDMHAHAHAPTYVDFVWSPAG